jgi:hypothetical protein
LAIFRHSVARDGYLDVTTVTLPDLKWRWVWDPLRSDLRFEKIVASLAPE